MRIVICGAGTAGCVAAARLSQDPATRSSLLEVGPHYRPGEWPAELTHSHRIIKETHDWGYLARAGDAPRMVHVPRGRVVGGSSVTNGAIALRGHPEHYDEWDDLVNGYDWESWLPWFRAIEADRDFGGADWHGDRRADPDQPLPAALMVELQERFVRGGAVGRPRVDRRPQRARARSGIGPIPLNMVDGVRQTPADLYLDPALARENLTLRARGPGRPARLRAASGSSGVVVAGPDGPETLAGRRGGDGARHLRHARRRSCARGSGPPRSSRRHGIGVVAAIDGVGRGMQDHPKVSYRFDLGLGGAALAEPLVPVPSDRRPRGRGRAARLPGDALLGPDRGRPPLHRPQRPGGRRPLAPRRRAPAEPRPGRPAGDRDGLVPRARPTAPRPSPPAGG